MKVWLIVSIAALTACAARTSLDSNWSFTADAAPPDAAPGAADASPAKVDACAGSCEGVESTILFGGLTNDVYAANDGYFGDTWEWNGKTWTQLPPNGPSARTLGAAAPNGDHVLLFGGGWDPPTGGDVMPNETWARDAGAWKLLTTSGPSGREYAAMAQLGGTVVLFGGLDANNVTLGDTWIWDGKTWTQSDAVGPAPRSGAKMATLNGKVLMFGGYADTSISLVDDAWEWDGASWTPSAPSGGPARARFGMAALGDRILVFGGVNYTCDHNACSDTWQWDGSAWTLVSTSGPSGRFDAAMTSRSDSIVLFGGMTSVDDKPQADTWIWNGSTWKDATPAVSPPARYGAVMATL